MSSFYLEFEFVNYFVLIETFFSETRLSVISDILSNIPSSMRSALVPILERLQNMQDILHPNAERLQSEASEASRSSNTTTLTSSTTNRLADVNAQTNRTTPQSPVSSARTGGDENPAIALGASPNVNVRPSITPPQTVARSIRSNGYENAGRALHESTHRTEAISVPRRRAAMLARGAIAGVYRRQQRK